MSLSSAFEGIIAGSTSRQAALQMHDDEKKKENVTLEMMLITKYHVISDVLTLNSQ